MQKWYEWLEHEKKKDEKKNVEDMHQHKVEQMIRSAEGSAGLLHNVSKPSAWRGGAQILVNEEEDARLLDRCEAVWKDWSTHWQRDEEVQSMQDKPWRNEELRKGEEALTRLKKCECTKQRQELAAGSDKRNERRNRGILAEGGTEWKVTATSLHNDVLLDSEECLRVRGRLRCCRR